MICAIVLAAGRSRRMGTQKLLLPWGGKSVIAQVVDEIGSGCDQVFVVTGADGHAVRAALADRAVNFVVNPQPESEMLESVRCGLRALPEECEGVLIIPGDQPTISAETVREIIRAFNETDATIVIPTFHGERGHPMVFHTKFREEVLTGFNGEGLNVLRKKHHSEVLELPLSAPQVLEDLDTPEEYERLRPHQFSPTSGG
jgi:molybdenum cofactor cytidylyltransferase